MRTSIPRTWRASSPTPSGVARAGPFGATGGRRFSARGSDAHYTLTVSFLDAANGTTRRITLPEGRTLDVRIPAGVRDGHILRLKGQGMPGLGDGAPGDALVEIAVAPHPLFRREGDDIIVELPVTIQEAVLGATLEVPTIKGKVRLTIPPNSGTGHAAAAARARHPSGSPVRAVARRAAAGRGTGTGRVPEVVAAEAGVQSARGTGGRMMLQLTAVTALFVDLPAQELTGWIERGWVRPDSADSGWVFQEIDVARVRLIHDLRRGMDVGEDTIPLVLSLLDQVYELRAQLKAGAARCRSRSRKKFGSAIQRNLSRESGRGRDA